MRTARRAPAPALPAAQPVPRFALALLALLAAALVALAVSFRMDDADIWQHLAVGRALWHLHAIPHTDLWTWPGEGRPYLLPSWLFRVLLWPFWQAGGEAGLAVWRWLTALATFALLWRAARAAGAKGVATFVILVWCAMLYRQRSMVRPDTLALLLLAVELLLLERRRAGHRGGEWWLVALAALWANVHISYTLFFEVGLGYFADAVLRRREPSARPVRLALVLAASLLACLANPFGLRWLWEPFDYLLHQRHELIFVGIDELQRIAWGSNLRNGLPVLLALAAVLALARWRRRFDAAELVVYALFGWQAFTAERFLGPLAVVLAPFLARDLDEALARWSGPPWTSRALPRAALAAAACLLVAVPEILRPSTHLGFGFVPGAYPVSACDWVEAHGVRGRMFSPFDCAGYVLWRFWPEHDRRPFTDIHQTGTRRDRDLMAVLHTDARAWAELDARHRFEWVMLPRQQVESSRRVDFVEADTAFVPAFLDDDWVVWVRRHGALAGVADSEGYRLLPASYRRMRELGARVVADPAVRPLLRAELERSVRESPRSAHAHNLLANLAVLDGDWAQALGHFEAVRRLAPETPGVDVGIRAMRDSLAASRGRAAGPREPGVRKSRAPS